MKKELTDAQRNLLERAVAKTGIYIRGADVRVARTLAYRNLGDLTDNGEVKISGRADGERWFFTYTEAGRAALKGGA